MSEFIAISNSTIYDVCLNTYGTLNLLGKLMDDNNHEGVNTNPAQGQVFLFDENLVNVQTNQSLVQNYSIAAGENQLKYATA
jgi:hypothetical protein